MQKDNSFNTLACFTLLSKSLQGSRSQILAKIDNRFVFMPKDNEDDEKGPLRRRRSSSILSDEELNNIMDNLKQFADYLRVTPLQAAIFVAFYTCQLEDISRNEVDSLGRFFDITTVETLPMKVEYEYLFKNGYFKLKTGTFTRGRSSLRIDELLEQAITNNEPFRLSPLEKIDRFSSVTQ